MIAPPRPRILFVCGAPRSGTTALIALLNAHRSVCIGHERFHWHVFKGRERLNRALFDGPRFFDLRPGDTFHRVAFTDRELAKIGRYSNLQYVGDKLPRLYEKFAYLKRAFPDCRIVMLFRDVEAIAASYNARAADPADNWSPDWDYRLAAKDWNLAVDAYLAHRADMDIIPVRYEHVFSAPEAFMQLVLALNLGPEEIDRSRLEEIYSGARRLEKRRASSALSARDSAYVREAADMSRLNEIEFADLTSEPGQASFPLQHDR